MAAWWDAARRRDEGERGAARQGIEEGVGGYSGITNHVPAARMKEIALQELADR